MSEWRRIVRRELYRYRDQTGHDVVERQDLLDQSLPTLQKEFPNAQTPGQTLSRVLQELRDRDEIEFIGSGVYRIHELDISSGVGSQDDRDTGTDTADVNTYTATEYETTVGARSLPSAFRDAILDRYESTCPVSKVDHERLLDVAHILPWSDFPDHRTDPGNVVLLDKTHHAAFDSGLFTLDSTFKLHVSPEFETDCESLRRTLFTRDGERISVPDSAGLSAEYLGTHNKTLEWW